MNEDLKQLDRAIRCLKIAVVCLAIATAVNLYVHIKYWTHATDKTKETTKAAQTVKKVPTVDVEFSVSFDGTNWRKILVPGESVGIVITNISEAESAEAMKPHWIQSAP